MHLCGQRGVYRVVGVLIQQVGAKHLARVVAVKVGRKHRQRAQVDAVAILQQVKVIVADAKAHHTGSANGAAQGGTQPVDIVVAPLNVHIAKRSQLFNNGVRMGAAVKNIPQNMQPVHRAPANQAAKLG